MEVDSVLVYEVNDPAELNPDIQQARVADDVDRYVNEEDAELAKEDMAHYEDEQEGVQDGPYFGEEHNAKF